MKQELYDSLYKKYPKIFQDRLGFECDDGWYWLIDNLCSCIQGYLDSNPHLNISQVIATQVKEKFGGLRFYYIGGDETISGMVWHAEHLSYRICEECGKMENIGCTQGWIRTLCRSCYEKTDKSQEWKERK